MSVLLVGTWINIRRGHRHSCQRPSCPVVRFPSRGRARWVGRRRWPLSRRRRTSKGVYFYFPCVLFWKNWFYSFFKSFGLGFSVLLGMLVAKWEPTPCYHDAYSVGIPKGACGEKSGQNHCKTTVSPRGKCVFLVSKRTLYFFWEVVVWMLHICRARHPGPCRRSFIPGQLPIGFANIGGWLTYGDLAMDSCAQFWL